MANPRMLTRSFAGGEITPELYGRLDLTKFQTGLAKAENFQILPHGPAANRPGFGYIQKSKGGSANVRLIPFSYNTDQTYAIEFGDLYVRFYTNGGTLLETGLPVTGITQANPGVLSYTGTDPNNGDWMYLAAIDGMAELNGRYVIVANVNGAANTFELTDLNGNNINTSSYGTYITGGTASRVYTVTSPFASADLFDIHYVQSADVLTLVHPSYAPRELRRSAAVSWAFTTISFAPTISAPGSVTATATGAGAVTYKYEVTAVASDGFEESVASSSATCVNNLATAGNYNTVAWAAVSGAARYNVYKFGSGLYGYIGQSDGTSFVDNNIIPDESRTPPITSNPFNASGDYPGAVSYFEQRRCFAGTNNKPQNLWMTRSATESNMSYSVPVRDDDAIIFRAKAREANRIRHLVPLGDLLLLTAGGEWKLTAQNSDAITPTSVSVRPQSYRGANNVQPVVTSDSCLYVQALNSRVHELKYQWESQGYTPEDVSIMAPHLFRQHTIVDIAFSRAPTPTLWCVRDDGYLLGLTYVPEHDVKAWHHHITDGSFKSVCCVVEGNEDVLYAVIERNIDGRTVKYIERLHSRDFTNVEDAFFVDSGLTYSGTAATTIGGLWHLNGEMVAILADGAVHPQRTVVNGSITLEAAASKVHVGLPYTCDLQTLPIALQDYPAFGVGMLKNVNEAFLRVYQSSNVEVGPTFDDLVVYPQRTTEVYGDEPALISEEISVMIYPNWDRDAGICVRQSDPLPITLSSLVLDVATGG